MSDICIGVSRIYDSHNSAIVLGLDRKGKLTQFFVINADYDVQLRKYVVRPSSNVVTAIESVTTISDGLLVLYEPDMPYEYTCTITDVIGKKVANNLVD